MTDQILTEIRQELGLIRALLEIQVKAASAPAQATQARASTGSGGARDEAPPPMPTRIWPDAENFQITFGKNQGKSLGELADNSLSWYCKDPEPKLDSSGKPYPPRQSDMELRQAARTVYHRRKGAIPKDEANPPYSSGGGTSPKVDDGPDVPFAVRHLDHG